MRSSAIVLMLIVITSSLAVASELSDAFRVLVKGAAVQVAGNAINRATAPRPEQVVLTACRMQPATVIVSIDQDGCGWDSGRTVLIAQNLLGAIGFDVIPRQGREDIKEEMRETNSDPAYNKATAVPFGQLVGAEYFAYVSVEIRDGRERRIRVWQDGAWGEKVECEVCADLSLKIVDQRGIARSAICRGSSWCQLANINIGSWFRSVEYDSRQPVDEDLAVAVACARAINQIVPQLAPNRGDPGAPIQCAPERTSSAAGFCPACGAPAQSGWRFCPKCGGKLPH